jgi:hypothetical protein
LIYHDDSSCQASDRLLQDIDIDYTEQGEREQRPLPVALLEK